MRAPWSVECLFVVTSFLLSSTASVWAASPEQPLWPGEVPGETTQLDEEQNMSKPGDHEVAGKTVIRLGNVSRPTLQFFPAPADKATGTTVVVFPGGGYHILALDLEGTEVCDWLNSIGVHAVLVKYRVPRRADREKHAAPLQDAQRAIGLVRHRAAEWKIKADRIGVLGFSAGGHLAATASLTTKRTYPRQDDADQVSCRPNFTFLIYPGYLVDESSRTQLAQELPVTNQAPPTFLVMSQDDPVDARNVLVYASALQEMKVPYELHVFPTGGHGYGLRKTELPVTHWPQLAESWMRQSGWLTP